MTQLVPPDVKVRTIRALLERSKGQITMALPRPFTADRMLRVAMTCIQKTPALLDCTEISLLGAIIQAAQLGLEPDGLMGRAYLIPRRNTKKGVVEAHFQVGYQGLMELARRSEEVKVFDAREVYGGDDFEYCFGTEARLRHVPEGDEDEAKITHVYALARLRSGDVPFEVMTRGQIEAHRKRYSRTASDDSAWVTAWPGMARKTVIIKLCKYLPASIELRKAVALVERDDAGLPQDLGALVEGAAPPSTGSAVGDLTERLRGEAPAPPSPAAPDDAPGSTPAPPAPGPAPASASPPVPPAPDGPGDPTTESERSLTINKALNLRTALKLNEHEWERETKTHLGGVAISRADLAQLHDLVAALERLATDRMNRGPKK